MTRVILPKAIEVVSVYGATDIIVEILGIPPPGGGGGPVAASDVSFDATGLSLFSGDDVQEAIETADGLISAAFSDQDALIAGKENAGVAASLLAAHVAAPDPHTQYALETDVSNALALKQALSAKDQPSGYAGLDGSGKINPLQLPAIAITDTFVVNTEVAMLALAAETGDIAVRTDLSQTFILRGDDPTVLADWQELETPTDAVSSVFGRSGTVTAQSGDYTTAQVTESVNLYFTGARAIAAALTGFTPGAGTVAGTDSVLQAIQKLDGNDAAKVGGPGSATDNAVARFDLATGKLIQNSGVTIDDNGMLGLPAITPSAPASGLNWGAFSLSGLILPGFMQSGMVAARALPMDWRKFGWYGSNSTTYGLDGAIAMSPTGTGTSKAWAATNVYTRAISTESLVTTPATNAVAGYRSTTAIMTVGGASAAQGGFYWKSIWGPATGVSVSTTRAFWGVRALTSGPSDVEPSGLVNMVGMGWDAADTNIQMMHNDGSGTATKIDLGASFPRPAVDRTELYSIELFSLPGTTQSVVYRVVRLSTGVAATGTITTDLPSTGQILTYNTYLSVGGTSSVIGVALERIETYLFPETL